MTHKHLIETNIKKIYDFVVYLYLLFKQVRVICGKEPPCFLNLFRGQMVVYNSRRDERLSKDAGTVLLLVIYLLTTWPINARYNFI